MRLEHIFGDYFHYSDGGARGSLVRRDAHGDTLLPPFVGRFTILEDADSLTGAEKSAREWHANA